MASDGTPEWAELQLLLAVLEAGSLTRAAAETGISQPTISRRIAALEAKLKVPLLYRSPSGTEPTPLARRMAGLLRTAGGAVAEVARLARNEAEQPRRLRLTTTTTLAMFLAEHVGDLAPAGFCLDIVPTRDKADFVRHESDIAIRLRKPPAEGPVRVRKIGALAFAVYAPKRMAGSAVQRYIGLSDNRPPPHAQWFDAFVAARGAAAHVRLGEVYLRLAAVKQGLGASLLPCLLGDREAGLTRLTQPVAELTEDIYLLVHKDISSLPACRETVSRIVRLFRAHAGALAGMAE